MTELASVPLQPFAHQVGGHTCMFSYNPNIVCKPYGRREFLFYQGMPTDLVEFVPKYKGVVTVTLDENGGQGAPRLIAHSEETINPPKHSFNENSVDGTCSDVSDTEDSPPAAKQQRFSKVESHSCLDLESDSSNDSDNGQRNSHMEHLHRKQITHMQQDTSKAHKFLCLENLLSRFSYPCVLDLKMGTRQHGDDADDAKRKLQMQKCRDSTSSKLGVRICGMKVYNANTGTYDSWDKYFGRGLSVDEFKKAMYKFLHNGERVRTEFIDPVVSRLRLLKSRLAQQNTYRFYSSSLLIIYNSVDLKTGDTGPEKIGGSYEHKYCSSDGEPDSKRDCEGQLKNVVRYGKELSKNVSSSACNIDIRMIDFAHSTHAGFKGDNVVHSGPDHGYIFGLENLINIFEAIKNGEIGV